MKPNRLSASCVAVVSLLAAFATTACGDSAGDGAGVPTVKPTATTTPGESPPPTTPPPAATTPTPEPAKPDPYNGVPAPPADAICHPLAGATCALPFPSNWFSRHDAASPTGIRVRAPSQLLRATLATATPKGFTPEALLTDQPGFSASGPLLFELSAAPDPATIRVDGGAQSDLSDATVAVFDLATGERVPIRVEIGAHAASTAVKTPSAILRVFPRTRFGFGHHYVATVTNRVLRKTAVVAGDGATSTTLYAQPKILADDAATAATPAGAYHAPLLDFVGRMGIARSRILSMTDFHVRPEDDATAPLLDSTRDAYGRAHAVRKITVNGSTYLHVQSVVTGEVALTDYRDATGAADIVHRATVNEVWVPFVLTIPDSATTKAAPVAIYGHPLMGDRNFISLVAATNAEHGFATIAIDHPNHGDRATHDGGQVALLRNPADVPKLTGMLAQSPIDQASLLKAVRTSLASLDVAPRAILGAGGDGHPDLDPTRVIYQGTSLGGVLGSAFIASSDALDLGLMGAYLQVSGSGFLDALTHSSLWTNVFSTIIPSDASGAEAEYMVTAVGQRIEQGDSLPIADKIKAPLFVAYGVGDEVVCNATTLALAELAHLPLLNPVITHDDVGGLTYVGTAYPPDAPMDRRGLLQVKVARTGVIPLDLETHMAFLDSGATESLGNWLTAMQP